MSNNGTINSAPDIVIEARDVEKTYDTGSVKVFALRGVSLQVPRGEMLVDHGRWRQAGSH